MRIFDIVHKPAAATRSSRRRLTLWGVFFVFSLLFATLSTAAVKSLTLLALFEDKALFHIDGQRRLLHTGETSPEGVELISADAEEAVVNVNGRQEVLQLGLVNFVPELDAAAEPSWSGHDQISLWADSNGFFYVPGRVNGYPVRFLVDTGATSVALSSALAKRIGLDYTKGRRGVANTASGVTSMFGLKLDSVSVGGINLKDVDAGVIEGSFPLDPLLGMSFLGQLDMVREGNRMDLKRRN